MSAVSAFSTQLTMKTLEKDNPVIRRAIRQYVEQFDLPRDAQPTACYWYGIFKKDTPLVVVGTAQFGEILEITDLYMIGNTRETKLAVYSFMFNLKKLVDTKKIKYVYGVVLDRNEAFKTVIKRTFGVNSFAAVFSAGTL